MSRNLTAIAIALFSILSAASDSAAQRRPVHTYSIVARDSATGQLGVAVQSHWFGVGALVAWAEAGVGAVATQSFIDPAYGPLGLDLMRTGKSAEEALKGLIAADAHPEVRQVAFVDARGNVAAHTGEKAIDAAGHIKGARLFGAGESDAQADRFPLPWRAPSPMPKATSRNVCWRHSMPRRPRGGDIRGKQAAAILIVNGTSSGRPWADRMF